MARFSDSMPALRASRVAVSVTAGASSNSVGTVRGPPHPTVQFGLNSNVPLLLALSSHVPFSAGSAKLAIGTTGLTKPGSITWEKPKVIEPLGCTHEIAISEPMPSPAPY